KLDASEPHLIPMILQENVPSPLVTESGNVLVLTLGDQRLELRTAQFEFDHLGSVEPVFHMVALNDQPHFIPLADRMQHFVGGGDQVIERACRSVPVPALFRVRMPFIVEDLHFESHSGVSALDHFLSNKVLDATVTSGADAPLKLQFKVRVLINGDDVAPILALLTVSPAVLDRTVLNTPAFFRELVSSKPAPAVCSPAIKQQLPPRSLFLRSKGVRGCRSAVRASSL